MGTETEADIYERLLSSLHELRSADRRGVPVMCSLSCNEGNNVADLCHLGILREMMCVFGDGEYVRGWASKIYRVLSRARDVVFWDKWARRRGIAKPKAGVHVGANGFNPFSEMNPYSGRVAVCRGALNANENGDPAETECIRIRRTLDNKLPPPPATLAGAKQASECVGHDHGEGGNLVGFEHAGANWIVREDYRSRMAHTTWVAVPSYLAGDGYTYENVIVTPASSSIIPTEEPFAAPDEETQEPAYGDGEDSEARSLP